MIWICAAAGVLVLTGVLCVLVSEKCLKMVVKPVRYDRKHVCDCDTENGFGDCIEAYENQWDRTSFTVVRPDAEISGEYILHPADAACGIRGERSGSRVVIICHGHTVNRYASLKYAKIFYELGFTVVIYDERYFGDSTGAFCTLGQKEAEDLAAVIARVREIFGKDCRIGLHGESMGAATVLMVLMREAPDFVIADCPFADTRLLMKDWIAKNLHIPSIPLLWVFEILAGVQYGYKVREVSPVAAVKQSKVPICFMHGREDSLIFANHSQQLYRECRNEKSELHLFEGADHAQSIVADRKGYERIVKRFLASCRVV